MSNPDMNSRYMYPAIYLIVLLRCLIGTQTEISRTEFLTFPSKLFLSLSPHFSECQFSFSNYSAPKPRNYLWCSLFLPHPTSNWLAKKLITSHHPCYYNPGLSHHYLYLYYFNSLCFSSRNLILLLLSIFRLPRFLGSRTTKVHIVFLIFLNWHA